MTSFGAARLAWPLLILLAACAPTAFSPAPRDSGARAPAASADDFRVVDCLLPGQVRQLGQYATYVSRRRPVQTTARDCQVRGGEYVAHDPASYAAALQVWLPLANQDDREAQTIVGELYEKGLGRAPDYRMAAQWYRKAAEAGEARAQINLAHLYEKGLGLERDPAAALRWYRQAAGVDLALDPQTLNADRQERNALKDELARSRRELGGTRSELARLRARLEDAERKVQRLEQPAAPGAPMADATGSVERERELERLRSEIRQLKARALEAQKQAAERPAAQAAPPVAVAGPSIQILDPPLTATTRGVQLVNVVNVAQDLPNRAVVGQVTAPAGVLSVIVDGREAPLDARGIFKTAIPIRGAATEVSVVAIDKLGARASVAFVLESRGQVVTPAAPAPAPAPEPALSRELFGRYHALVVGNDRYERLPPLKTAVADARAVAGVLQGRYGFRVTVLENATRYDFLSALSDLGQRLTSDDNLLLYYAGHGDLDRVNNRGHWLPVDAEPQNKANWISNVDVTDHLNIMKAKQILVVADSCYSGALTRSALAHVEGPMTDAERAYWLRVMAGKRSRTVLTSGGLEPVLDIGGGEHSVFAKALLEVLRANRDIMEGRRLHLEVAARVTRAASEAVAGFEQVPDYAPIRYTGHDGGDFFLVATGS